MTTSARRSRRAPRPRNEVRLWCLQHKTTYKVRWVSFSREGCRAYRAMMCEENQREHTIHRDHAMEAIVKGML